MVAPPSWIAVFVWPAWVTCHTTTSGPTATVQVASARAAPADCCGGGPSGGGCLAVSDFHGSGKEFLAAVVACLPSNSTCAPRRGGDNTSTAGVDSSGGAAADTDTDADAAAVATDGRRFGLIG